ncbi:HSPG2 (predicted) [Pycnogonum litorale]
MASNLLAPFLYYVYFRMTLNFTSIPYEPNLATRTSPQFQRLSGELITAIEALYGSTKGQQHVTILKFEPGSLIATIDLGSLNYYEEDELKNVISRAIQRGFIGDYRVSDRGFTFRSLGESPEPIPSPLPGICRDDQFKCSSGECIESYKRCNRAYDCIDGSDELVCPDDKICPEGQALCDGSKCIGRSQICDGRIDCLDQTDEINCPTTKPEPSTCATDEFRCNSGKCIKFVQRCNIEPDCPEGEDESMCPECPDNAFRCRRDGRCILDSLVCNYVQDCADGSDEFNCRSCSSNEFRCNDGKCIFRQLLCNGAFDCSDGADEKNCPKCKDTEFICLRDRKCIDGRYRCDKKYDCTDGSDEDGCDIAPKTCAPDQFSCNDGTCVGQGKRCNGNVDCSDGSDEENCEEPSTCAPNEFSCDNQTCIDVSKKCDGTVDCSDGSDEKTCAPKTCSSNEFTCNDGTCIDARRKCDGQNDCNDASDEIDCGPNPCTPNDIYCDGRCIPVRAQCDGIKHCRNGQDEQRCDSTSTTTTTTTGTTPEPVIPACKANEFRCISDGRCVTSAQRCDGINQCSDNSDEANCDTTVEPTTAAPCGFVCQTTGQCIDQEEKCDGIRNCPDGSDEYDCDTKDCDATENFECDDGSCIDLSSLCDGIKHCPNNEDESNCETTLPPSLCKSNEFQCSFTKTCIELESKCDGVRNCPDGSDELGCVTLCTDDQFRCGNGSCIEILARCDGLKHCPENEDERDCDTDQQCNNNQFKCLTTGRCVDLRARCDGVAQCYDGSDETGCDHTIDWKCYDDEFTCRDGSCISSSYVCDGLVHCPDNSDEYQCGTVPKPLCPKDTHHSCPGESICIVQSQVCDGRRDCSDGSDEKNCNQCSSSGWLCQDRTCIDVSRRCDGRHDCRDYSDERDCACKANEFRCGDGRCIDNRRLCDRRRDCSDGSDELNCRKKCSSSEFRCSDGSCIDLTKRCDRNYDCTDYSDERKCDSYRCRSGEHTCSNGQCVDGAAKCNGRRECNDGSDEDGCETLECRVSQFRCLSGECVDRSKLCDGNPDCPDRSDESDYRCRPSTGDYNIRIYPERQRIKQTREVVFRCRDEGTRRSPVKWSRADNQPMPSGYRDVNGRLTLPNIQLEHSGIYICTAIASTSGSSGSSRAANLIVEPFSLPTVRPPTPGVCSRTESTCQNGECILRDYVCDEDYDCTDRSDEFNCGAPQKCEPNEFECDNGNCVGKYWRCDGENDCGDNSDERKCEPNPPGSPCRYFEYQCTAGNQCIPRSFQCDGDVDCQDGSDEIGCSAPTIIQPPVASKVVNVGEIVIIECVAIGIPTPIITWRLNWKHVPNEPRITSTSKDGRGVLTIRDAQDSDQGAYTCEAINIKDRVIAQPDCILVVKSRPGVCTSPFFNSNGRSPSECLRCFCFGVSESCQSSNLRLTPQQLGRNAQILSLTKSVSGEFVPLSDSQTGTLTLDFSPSDRSYRISDRSLSSLAVNNTYYWNLPQKFLGNQLKVYGGYMRYTVRYRPGVPSRMLRNLPDVIIVGKEATIYHYTRSKINPQTDNRIEAWIYEGQWQKSPNQDPAVIATTSRTDIMMALQDVVAIYIRASYDLTMVESVLSDFSMDVAERTNGGGGGGGDGNRAIYVEMCSCPEGYEGLSCERCKSGYVREKTGRFLGRCVQRRSRCNCNGHSDVCNPRTGQCVNCRHNSEGRQCERCIRGFYGDARRGTADDCRPCPCPLTIPPNQFSPSCYLASDNEVSCDSCPPGYEGRRCERCAPNYSGNPLVVNDYCKPNTSRCDPIGSVGPRLDPRTGRCRCKPYVTGPRCDQCSPNTFHLNKYSTNGCLDCFCSGITRSCTSCSLYRTQISTDFTNERHGFTLSDIQRTYQTDRGLSIRRSDKELVYSNFGSQPRQTYYWQLPSSFLGNKLTSYGGYLNFTVSYSAGFDTQPNTDPDVLISGNDIVLVYRYREAPRAGTGNTISIPLYETLWRRQDGGDANREHMLMALADLQAILIKATYTQETTSSSIKDVSLDHSVEGRTGQSRAYAVEQCRCPPGYVGLSCEKCDSGYKRSGGGLYLGLCDPCSCNGHSTNCHPTTGVCRNCQHNTVGDFCDRCAPGFSGDATRGTATDCSGAPEPNCRCDVRGSTGQQCSARNQCPCKSAVEGPNCDRCKRGHFMLDTKNPAGCTACFCFGITQECSSGTYFQSQVTMDLRDAGNNDYVMSDRYGSERITKGIRANPSRSEMFFTNFPLETTSPLYWSLPAQFLGNKLTSYGGKLRYTQRYTADVDVGNKFSDADIQITGNGIRIVHVNTVQLLPDQSNEFVIDLTEEKTWQIMDVDGPRAARHKHLMMVLANVESFLIRASFHTNMRTSYLSQVSMDIALPSSTGKPVVESVEQCRCPPGYIGSSCEDCAPGYSRDKSIGQYLGRCTRCNCNSHAESCDAGTGQCVGCRHNTVGANCERCADGFYGDARTGTTDDCKPCSCPLPIPSNKFSPTCFVDSDGRPTCNACLTGYKGRNCESCAEGYRGDPTQPGDRCVSPGPKHGHLHVLLMPAVVRERWGKRVILFCYIRSVLDYKVVWLHKNLPIAGFESNVRIINTYRGSTLDIPFLDDMEVGSYTCRVSSAGLVREDIGEVIMIGESQRIQVSIDEPKVATLPIGASVTFKCSGRSELKDVSYTLSWSKENGELSSRCSEVNGELTIRNVQLEDGGTYICTASDLQTIDQERAVLIVEGSRIPTPPRVKIDPYYAKVNAGDRVQLTCTAEGFPKPELKWTGGRDNILNPTSTFKDGVFTIPSAVKSDEAEYYCSATNSLGSDRLRTLILVTQDGDRGNRRQAPRLSVYPELHAARPGDTVRLTCRAEGVPTPVISWSRSGGRSLPDDATVSGGSVTIVNVDSTHAGTYVCSATNSVSTNQVEVRLTVDTRTGDQPPTARIEPEKLVIGRNGVGELKCYITGSPTPKVRWSRVGNDLSSRIEIVGDSLKVNGAIEVDQGTYICQAENRVGSAQAAAYMYIESREPPSIEIYPEAVHTVSRGSSAIFQCRVTSGIPSPIVKWTRRDQRSFTTNSEVLSAGVIRFNRVTDEEQGIYVCTAENVAGRVSAEATLQIKGTPTVTIQPSSPYNVQEGERVRMMCTASGDPTPNVLWKRRTRKAALGSEEITLKEGRGTAMIEIERVNRLDAGMYLCSASNRAGVAKERSIELRVGDTSVVPGVKVQTPLVTVNVGSRAELRCSVYGERTGVKLKWVRVDGARMPRDFRVQDGTLYIFSAQPEDQGEYSCIGTVNGNPVFTANARLAIVAPPRISLNPIRQVVRTGDNVRIQCTAQGEAPITIDWTRSGGGFPAHASDRNGILEFRGIQVGDAGRYICTAVNAAGRAEATAEVVVNGAGHTFGGLINNKKATVGELTQSKTAYVGSNIELKCDIQGARPSDIRWQKENGRLDRNSRIDNGQLWIRSVTRENEGRYICQARTPVGVGRQYILLNVQAVPTLMVKIKPSKKTVHLGNDLDLRCLVEGASDAQVTWTKLQSNETFPKNVQVYGKVLSIRSIKAQNGGIYRCSVDSYAGVFNDDYVLAIQATPVIPPGEVETRKAPFGSTVVMDCPKKLPGRVAYTWSKQGGSLPPQTKINDGQMVISNVRADDAGIYVCTIKNDETSIDVPTILVITGVVPYFSQSPSSYLSLPTLPAYVEFDIEISLKPEKPDGIVLYNGQQVGSGDYIAFGLANGHAEFRFELGSGPAVVRSNKPLELGKWHTVRLSRNGKQGRLVVDDEPEVNAVAQGRFRGLDLQEPLFVGGVSDFKNIGKQSGFTQGFVGCIGRLVIGGVEHDLVNDAQTSVGVTSCETCSDKPCMHGGVCQEALTKRGYECICAAGFSGENCEKVGEACYPGVCGQGKCINKPGGFECYCPFGKSGHRCEKDVIILEPAFSDDAYASYPTPTDSVLSLKMGMKFKLTDVKDGLLMYCAQNENGQGDFVSMAIKDECLEFRFDTGSGPAILRSQRKLIPDEWVTVKAERTLQDGSLVLNDDPMIRGRSPGQTLGLNLLTPVYVGGYDPQKITVSPFAETKNGFNGCISKFELNDVEVDLVSKVLDASNVEDCAGKASCESKPCMNDGTCVQLAGGRVDYTCLCRQGFSGRHCEKEENICDNIQPCMNGGSCKNKGSTYNCSCPLGYGGEKCEKDAMFTTKAQFQGDSYLELDSQLLPHTSTVKEIIKASFHTTSVHGVLFFHGQKPETDGKGRDYLVVAIVDGFLVFSYELGSGSAEIRSTVKVNDGKKHRVVLERTGRKGSLKLDDLDAVVGESQGQLEMLNTEGNIYVGGVPNHDKMTADQFPKGWDGCIYDLEIQESNIIDLFMNARRGTNVLACTGMDDSKKEKSFLNRLFG